MAKKKAKKKRKQTLRQKRLSNIRQNIRRMEKRGYQFPEGYYDSIKNLTTRQLGKIKPETLYEEAGHVVSDTGDWVQGTEFRKLERHWAALKGQATKQRKAKERSDRSYVGTSDYYDDTDYPDHTEISYANIDSLMNVLGKEPHEEGATSYGEIIKRRNPDALKQEQQEKNMLQRLLESERSIDPEGLAQRLDDYYDDIESYIDMLTYASDEATVQSAGDAIAQLISGRKMTLAEKAQYADWSEENNEW